MTRSGYSDECDGWELEMWRGAVRSAIRGKRRQAFLREMVTALDALPEKRLLPSVLVSEKGCCAMGAVAMSRGLDTSDVDPYDREAVADLFDVAGALVAEIAFENDEDSWSDTSPEARWQSMRAWAVAQIRKE